MSDYERITRAIQYLVRNGDRQPLLEEVAEHLALSPFHAQRLFSRWTGVTPKRFLQVLTVERARQLLAASWPLLDVSEAVGLSSASRLYDHFVQIEAMTPGEARDGGAGLAIDWAVHDSPFGPLLLATTARGICRIEFVDAAATDEACLRRRWPRAQLRHAPERTTALAARIFAGSHGDRRPLSLHVSGTNFQVNVWRALLRVAPGGLTTYARLAQASGRAGAAQAVGQAVGANPVALLIPCHRVIRQSGALGGYRWGALRKHAILAWESARCDAGAPADVAG